MLTSGRTTNILLIIMIAVGVGIALMLATGVRGGPLDPPGPVASTQSNVIYQPAAGCAGFPIVLSTPGSYRLGGNITGCNGTDGIRITSRNVSLDLAGFSVIGVPGSLDGIKNVGLNNQLNIANGTITDWGATGLNLTDAARSRVDNVIASGNFTGITLDTGTALTNSTASGNTGVGISSVATATDVAISGCHVNLNNSTGIQTLSQFTVIEDCEVSGNGNHGIQAGAGARIADVLVANNSGSGIGLSGNDHSVDHALVVGNAYAGIFIGGSRALITNCQITGNSALGVLSAGILGGEHVTVDHCSVTGTIGDAGISTGPFARITNNHIGKNGGAGLRMDHSCYIAGNSLVDNGGDGLFLFSPGKCTIVENEAKSNGSDGFDLQSSGSSSHVDNNDASNNSMYGFNIGAANPGFPNIVTRNTASANIVGNYLIGASNDTAPITQAASVVNPLSNIQE